MPPSRATPSPARSPRFSHQRLLPAPRDSSADTERLDGEKASRGPRRPSVFTSWIWEFLGLGMSVLCLATMLILLLVYKNKTVPELSMGLTFNAIISVLITASKAAMLSAVGSAMGQSKWQWFRDRTSPLINLEVFDDASRLEPWGVTYFLFKIKWRSIAAVGAFVALLSLAMDPFAQQLLDYPIRNDYTSSPKASIAVARNVDPLSSNYGNQIQRSVNDAIWNAPRTFSASCPTGNCTFPVFEAISWCPRCEDITDSVVLQGCDMAFNFTANVTDPAPLSCNISISSGVNITSWSTATYLSDETGGYGSHGDPNTKYDLETALTHVWEIHEQGGQHWGAFGGLGQTEFLGNPQSMLAMGQVDFAYDTSHPFQPLKVKSASGCTMNPCLKQYSASTAAGITTISTSATFPGVIAIVGINNAYMPSWFQKTTTTPAACWVSDYKLLSDEDAATNDPLLNPSGNDTYCLNGNKFSPCTINATYVMCQDEAAAQTNVITTLLSGNLSQIFLVETRDSSSSLTANSSIQATTSDADYSSYTFQQMVQYSGLNQTLQNVASSLTVMMQNLSSNAITGDVGHAKAFVHVRWPWLIYPAIVIFMGIVFVMAIILNTTLRHEEVWKNSSVAVVYHGLRDIPEATRLDAMDMESMERRARSTNVRFEDAGLKES